MESIFRSGLFQGQVALVTGGGSGIGLRIARELASLGARVFIAGRNEERLASALSSFGPEQAAQSVRMNIRDEAEVDSAIAHIVREAGKLDLLVNNAGGQFPSPAAEIKRKGWDAVIETNLTGTFQVSRAAFRAALEKHGGAIVNIIAEVSHGFPMMAHTGAARAGVENLTRSLANEWGRFKVRVNCIAPGIIQSSGIDTYASEFQTFVRSMGRFNQANRLGTEAEIAAATLFLLSPAASYITGETLRVDGGAAIYTPIYPPVEHEPFPPFDPAP
ncbi:MAG: SDR family oxidoreductase [Leptospiraceae bacterium]|nr:SDR family oxidoreductase [Leptospiraceae bacterium]